MGTRFIPVDELNKNRSYVIVGIPKCGTTSLARYMDSKGFCVIEAELDFLNVEFAENFDYLSHTPIIVTRNPIKRVWSDYNYFERSSFYEATDYSQYKAGLTMWDSLIYSLEYLQTLPDFPHENIGQKQELTNDIKLKIIEELV